MALNHDLGNVCDQGFKALPVMIWQAIPNHDEECEIIVQLPAQGGQGEALEKLEPFFQSVLGVQKRDAVLQRLVFDLETTDGGVRETA